MIIDCFFPKETGSLDLTLGYSAIDQLLKFHNDGLPEAYRDQGLNSPIARMLTSFEESFGRESARNDARKLKIKSPYLSSTINYWLLEQAMKEDGTNQPLGILVGEKAMELRIPFILATSTFHHDELTQPIEQTWKKVKKWLAITPWATEGEFELGLNQALSDHNFMTKMFDF